MAPESGATPEDLRRFSGYGTLYFGSPSRLFESGWALAMRVIIGGVGAMPKLCPNDP